MRERLGFGTLTAQPAHHQPPLLWGTRRPGAAPPGGRALRRRATWIRAARVSQRRRRGGERERSRSPSPSGMCAVKAQDPGGRGRGER
jgi:hypothetical protein